MSDAYRRYRAVLQAFLMRRVSSRQEAEDLTQDTYARFCALEDVRSVQNPKAFLFRTAINLVTDLHRREKVRADHAALEVEAFVDPDEVAASVEEQRRLQLLEAAIAGLPPRCREVFILHRFRGWSHRRIADEIGLTVHAVEKHMVRALKRCETSVRDAAGLRADATPNGARSP